ncbi:MAG: hypothetical protein H0X56_05430 [Solirubrobacterales bacterium]|nr:hypothetical protein [Solirubrobacterales bacterium]
MRAGTDEVVTVRLAEAADRAALERLAGRDNNPVPTGEVLLAAVDGEVRAALSLDGATVVADPFRPTAELVELLRLRSAQLRRRRPRRTWTPRRARAGAMRARPA